jgi:hypothetical protein
MMDIVKSLSGRAEDYKFLKLIQGHGAVQPQLGDTIRLQFGIVDLGIKRSSHSEWYVELIPSVIEAERTQGW